MPGTENPLSRNVFAAIASRSAGRPAAGVYLWFFGSRHSAYRGFDDVLRRGEVGFAGAEADDAHSAVLHGLRLQRLRLRIDRQGCRLCDGSKTG